MVLHRLGVNYDVVEVYLGKMKVFEEVVHQLLEGNGIIDEAFCHHLEGEGSEAVHECSVLFAGLFHLHLLIYLEEVERGEEYAPLKVVEDLLDVGSRSAARFDPFVEHAIVDADAGLAILLSVYHRRKRPRALRLPDDFGLQHLLYLFPGDVLLWRGPCG